MSEVVLTANPGEGTISALRLDRAAGRLVPLATSGELPGCGTFVIDEPHDLVYAAYKGDSPGVATLRLDRATGELTELSRSGTGGSLTYLCLAHEGRFLLGVSYGAGHGWVWPVAQGVVGPAISEFSYRNLHCIVAAGSRVYAVSLGEDLIAQFHLSPDGILSPLEPLVAPAPRGSGPRHLSLDGENAYLVTEFSGVAIRYEVAPHGPLTPAESVDVLIPGSGLAPSAFGWDPGAAALIWGADIWRAGRWLLTSERSTSTITSTPVAADGRLGEPAAYSPTERQPRGFTVTADGAYVIVVGERSAHAALSRLEADGSLTLLDRVAVGAGANWVRVVP